jgi:RNA polymerase sigma-70 factor (ECF subfamily)
MSGVVNLCAGLGRALDGDDEGALGDFVRRTTPIVQARVARKLLSFRDRSAAGRDVRQEVEDLTQEVFLALFADGARVLRSWQPERGLSLENFVGLVAERLAVSILRSQRRSPWGSDPTLDETLDAFGTAATAEREAVSRDTLARLLDRLTEELSPLGRHLFELLLVEEMPVPEAIARTGLSSDAIYAWRSRLRRLARRLLAEMSEPPASPRRSVGDAGR